ncbi:phage integrase central domain-containing protein [Burkholderia sp. NLJ2]|uniref:phage integrase central domain-containing protein n=1 Tax=Burkholderia sp. NLJ2 TaxID=3090699 RepID=UPI003C6C5262
MSSLETDVFPKPGNRKLDAIRRDDCADILRPIRLTKTATASRTRRRMQQSAVGLDTRPHRSEPCHGRRTELAPFPFNAYTYDCARTFHLIRTVALISESASSAKYIIQTSITVSASRYSTNYPSRCFDSINNLQWILTATRHRYPRETDTQACIDFVASCAQRFTDSTYCLAGQLDAPFDNNFG